MQNEVYDRIFDLKELIDEVDTLLLKAMDRNLVSRLKLRRKHFKRKLDELVEDDMDIPENSDTFF